MPNMAPGSNLIRKVGHTYTRLQRMLVWTGNKRSWVAGLELSLTSCAILDKSVLGFLVDSTLKCCLA